jgi:hypothetical protein
MTSAYGHRAGAQSIHAAQCVSPDETSLSNPPGQIAAMRQASLRGNFYGSWEFSRYAGVSAILIAQCCTAHCTDKM